MEVAMLQASVIVIVAGTQNITEISRTAGYTFSRSNAVALVRQMKVNLKTKIKYNGQEYSSVEELPPEARSAYEKAIAAGSATISTKIVFNGREYASPEQMPPAERQLYEDAMKLAHDSDGIIPARNEASAALLTPGQWRLVILFVTLVLIALIVLLLNRLS
jgi:hypothetical protein